MRVLIASKRAPDRPGRRNGGVQTWVATIAAELRKLGHEVAIADALIRPEGRFDVGILNNWAHTGAYAGQCDRWLAVCHGIVPDEQPPEGRVAYTSEGVKRHWGGSGPVIRQPLDLSFWTPQAAPRRRLLRYSPRGGLAYLPDVSRELGLRYTHLRQASHDEARQAMRESACVLATGRAALEAMACGVPVLICDHRSAYQGPLVSFAPAAQMLENYSGRGGLVATRENVEAGIHEAMRAGSLRRHVETHHCARKVTEALLSCIA